MKVIQSKAKLLTILTLMVVANAALMQPAKADDDRRGYVRGMEGQRHDGRSRGYERPEYREHAEWQEHEMRARNWHRYHPVPVPHVVYAPPAVIYAPPPEPSGINLIIPFDFR